MKPLVEVIVLCGGRGERMSRPKALLPFGGVTLVEWVVRKFQPRPVIVVAAAGQELPPLSGATVVRDAIAERGPCVGLATGLRAAAGSVAFAVAADAPFVVPALAEFLAGRMGESAACVPVVGGVPQPLAAVYRTDLAAELLAWAGGPQSFLKQLPVTYLNEVDVRAIDPELQSFRDLDTPDDYASALASLSIPSEN